MKPHKYSNQSGKWLIYDNYIITEHQSHTDVDKEEIDILNEFASKHFKGDFGVIDNRINKNSINPGVYQYAKELMPNFSAFALVAYSEIAKDNFDVENRFIEEANIEYDLFNSLEEAKQWMKKTL